MSTLIQHRSYINFVPNVSPPAVINVGQYDDAFTISFYPVMVKRGIIPIYPVPVPIDEDQFIVSDIDGQILQGMTAEVRGTKRDGNGYSAAVTRSADNKAFIITGDKQMTAIAGENVFELVVYSDNKEISSANFILNVERAAMDDDTIVSDSVVRELLDVIDEADDIIAAAQQVEDALNTIDDTLTQQGKAADAKKVGDEILSIEQDLNEIDQDLNEIDHTVTTSLPKKVNQPLDENNRPTDGTSGQLLRTNGDGTTGWADFGLPTDEQTAEAVESWLDEHPEATTTVEDGAITEQKLSNDVKSSLSKNTVYISTIKTRYPSYDDDALLDEAIAQAQAKGQTAKVIWDGSDIYFSGEDTHVLKGFGGIDFNGSRIYMPDYDRGILLQIEPDETEDITVDASVVYAMHTTQSGLKSKVFAINDDYDGNADMCLGNRTTSGSSAVLYCAPAVKTTPDGFFVTGKLFLTPSDGDVTCYNVHDYPANTFEICNAEVVSYNSTNMSSFLKCSRSNTHIHNLVLTGQSSVNTFHDGIMEITRCCDVEIDHISGVNPIKSGLTSGYAFLLTSVSFIHMHDVHVGDGADQSWGVVGANHIANTVFERCTLNRWDCHYAQYGFNVVRDCTLNRIQYGIGYGTLLFENCIIVEKRTSSSILNVIEKRSDCVGVFDGNITVRNCTFLIAQQSTSLIRIWVDSDYYEKPSNAKQTRTQRPGRYLEKCSIPDGVKNIFFVGSNYSNDQSAYSQNEYYLKDIVFNCSDAVMDTYDTSQAIGSLTFDHCAFKAECYATRKISNIKLTVENTNVGNNLLKVDKNIFSISVANSVLKAVDSDEVSSFLTLVGCRLYGTQSFSKFNNYSAYGNVAGSKSATPAINTNVTG